MTHRSSFTRRWAAPAVAAALWLAGASPVAAWGPALLPHVQGLAFSPERPNDQEPTTALLSAASASGSWRVTGGRLVDPAQVELSLAPASPGAGMPGASTARVALGVLPAGRHELSVRAFVTLADGNLSIEEITVPFDVAAAEPAPPPAGDEGRAPLAPALDARPAVPGPGEALATGLSASHPNPFLDATTFGVSLAAPAFAEMAVFDLAGRRVVTLHRGELPAGATALSWDGRRRDGSRAPGGVYFLRLTLPDRVLNRRVVLLPTP